MNYDKEFDASGLACPLPIVKTKKALNDMASGQVLRVVPPAADPNGVVVRPVATQGRVEAKPLDGSKPSAPAASAAASAAPPSPAPGSCRRTRRGRCGRHRA